MFGLEKSNCTSSYSNALSHIKYYHKQKRGPGVVDNNALDN